MINKQTILAVDDTEINVDILIGILKKHEVIPALNGKDALEIVFSEEIDLILLDIMMPDMDGYEVCKILKDNPKTKDIPIIFITVKTGEEDIKKGFALGAVDYVTKPFNPVELLSRVNTHLELRNYRLQLEKRVEQELKSSRMKDQLLYQSSKQAAIGELLMHIAHQWKQPLTELSSINLKQLTKLELNQKISMQELQENSKKIEEILNFMSKTVETFQDFYKPNNQNTFFDINNAINQACKIIDATFNFYRIKLNINRNSFIKIYGNENEYAQVILNILNNAKDNFILKNTKFPTITIDIGEENQKSKVVIYDNGDGIDKDILEYIFMPFAGSKNSLGIGLYMSKTIIEKNGGTINAKNSDKGAVFTICL